MTASPKVSVYITNHNYGRFIRQAIESVLCQSLRDFELIIIDDGSTDESREIIESYAGRPGVIPIFQHNKGLTVTNNIALRTARGKYIMRLDADDWLDENALEIMAAALERDSGLGMVFPDYYMVDEAGHMLELVRRHDFEQVTLLDQPAHGACTMIRRQCLIDLDGYDESLRCQDGYDLWVRFVEHFRVKNVNLPLFYYRQHGSSLTKNEQRILDTRARIIERHARMKGDVPTSVAVIPVRGPVLDPSSPALERLGDRPVIDWTIEAALAARHLSHIVVTSPDPDVLAHVRRLGHPKVSAHARERRLALPNTHLEDTILDALDAYCADHPEPDAVVDLRIETPFRTAAQIDTAVEVMVLFDTEAVIAVRPETDLFHYHTGSGLAPVRTNTRLRLEREEMYREVGGLRVVRTRWLREHGSLMGQRVGHVVVDQRAALTLRSDWDWKIARMIVESERGSQAGQCLRQRSR